MGLIKMAIDSVKGALSGEVKDLLLEVFEADDMGERTVFTRGVRTRNGANVDATEGIITNGSIVHVQVGQFMMLVDGGKIVDYTAEPGYYEVNNSAAPAFLNGEIKASLKETLTRMKFGGETPLRQKVYYINMQEVKGIKFGTRNPINYFDSFYNAELFLKAHGTYSIQITEPLKFYEQVIPRNKDRVEIEDVNEQYMSEFLEAFQAAINQMSADGTRISFVTSKGRELSQYMKDVLDSDWDEMRGMEILNVGVASISYDEKSTELINKRNEYAMVGTDPSVMRGMIMQNITEGVRDAGSNEGGAMTGFMGVGMGMNSMNAALNSVGELEKLGNFGGAQNQAVAAGAVAATGAAQKPAAGWTCECGATNTGKFCGECGKPQPAPAGWTCECGATNTGKFCSECGKPAPAAEWTCECGAVNKGKFCSECGKPRA